MNSKIRKALLKYIDEFREDKKDSDPLFSTRSGKPLQVRNIRSSIDRAIINAKLKNCCVNDLRNTFIVHQLENGVPVEVVADVVGHKNIVTTQNYLVLLSKKYKPSGKASITEL